jgi:Transposase, Mutator family
MRFRRRIGQHCTRDPIERLNSEIRRRTEVVGIFPSEAVITRLIGAIPVDQNDVFCWSERRVDQPRTGSFNGRANARALNVESTKAFIGSDAIGAGLVGRVSFIVTPVGRKSQQSR